MRSLGDSIREARTSASLTQGELALRARTSQSAIANLERGEANPTLETLARVAASAGCSLRIELTPISAADPVVARYKRDVDRTLLRDNLRKSVDDRLRSLSEWQQAGRELERATREARKHK